MPAVSYKEFSGGLDRTLPIGVQDANKLWTLQNAYITSGKKVRKRPGLKLVTTGLTGSVGLEAINGGLCVFAQAVDGYTAPSGVGLLELTFYSPGGFATELVDVLSAAMFQGYPYVVAVHRTRIPRPPPPPGYATIGGTVVAEVVRHHYLDGGGSTLVTDVNCSHGESATVAASRVFTIGGEVVRYSAAGDARDWTTSSDAGFLPVALQHDQREDCTAVGTFRDKLVVFFSEGAQIWDVQVDPAANAINSRIAGVGTEYPQSLASFSQDLAFASQYGLRSIAVQQSVDRIDESDIGVAIDSLTEPAAAAHDAAGGSVPVFGIWIKQFGQYWACFNAGGYTQVFAYSFSKSAKLSCWSLYTFPVLLTGITTAAGKVYARTADALYELDDTKHTDDGTTISVDVQMAFQDAKTPGVEKQWYGADFVFEGSPTVSYLYDPSDTGKETIGQVIDGDTRSAQMVPVEVTSAALAPRFTHAADEAFSIDMATIYYNTLTASA